MDTVRLAVIEREEHALTHNLAKLIFFGGGRGTEGGTYIVGAELRGGKVTYLTLSHSPSESTEIRRVNSQTTKK